MTARSTPREFGAALKHKRSEANVTLETISERTKIAVRILAALEEGEFGKLPSRVFARMFLRQYLDAIGSPPGDWVGGFDGAWQQFLSASQPAVTRIATPPRRRRVGPWLTGLALVAIAVAAVLWVEGRSKGAVGSGASALPTGPSPGPAEVASAAPSPIAPPPAIATTTPLPRVVVIRTGAAPCWAEVRVAGERTATRLLPRGSTWEVEAGGKDVDIVLGDAGAASVEYLGQTRSPAGRRGEVARLHFAGLPKPAQGQR